MSDRFDTHADFEAWARESRSTIKEQLCQTGAILFRGFTSILGEEAFRILLAVIGTPMENYVGGSTPRTQLSPNTYTATELGGHYSVALHQEMSYLAESPAAIAFYCQHAARDGGRIVLADARAFAASLSNDVLARFREQDIVISRALPSRGAIWLSTGISRPWQDVFCTDDHDAVLAIAVQRGWHAAWHDDGTLRLEHGPYPAFRAHPTTGELFWFNQAHYYSPDCMVRWARRDGRSVQERYLKRLIDRRDQQHLNAVLAADGEAVEAGALRAIWDALVAAERPLAMLDGDILLLDNYRIMHGRERYAGERSMQAGLIAVIS